MSLSITVHQKYPDLLMNEHDNVKLECSQHSQSFNVILWYKHSVDQHLQLLGYLYRTNNYIETGVNREIKLEGDGASDAFLIMENVLTNDSAVYYCSDRIYTVYQIPWLALQKAHTISLSYGINKLVLDWDSLVDITVAEKYVQN